MSIGVNCMIPNNTCVYIKKIYQICNSLFYVKIEKSVPKFQEDTLKHEIGGYI